MRNQIEKKNLIGIKLRVKKMLICGDQNGVLVLISPFY